LVNIYLVQIFSYIETIQHSDDKDDDNNPNSDMLIAVYLFDMTKSFIWHDAQV
jgi:hypothetical protein